MKINWINHFNHGILNCDKEIAKYDKKLERLKREDNALKVKFRKRVKRATRKDLTPEELYAVERYYKDSVAINKQIKHYISLKRKAICERTRFRKALKIFEDKIAKSDNVGENYAI